jgi:hypothetical protein
VFRHCRRPADSLEFHAQEPVPKAPAPDAAEPPVEGCDTWSQPVTGAHDSKLDATI